MKALFLGAGASYECGMPLVWEFTNILRVNLLRRLDTNLFDFRSSTHLREQFETMLSNPNFHYERMVGELENLYLARGNQANIVHNAYRQLVECVQGLLLEDQLLTTALFSERVKDYEGIRNLVSINPCLHVFSLNHDVNFEEICKFHGVGCRDGFFENENNRYADIARFKTLTSAQMESDNLNFYKPGEVGANLLKLHGSLDMFAVEDKNLYLKCAPRDSEGIGGHVGEIMRLERHGVDVSNKLQIRATAEVQVLDNEGQHQFLRRSLLSGSNKFTGRFDQIAPDAFLNEFKQRLKLINELDVIGYGFGDAHINAIIAEWTQGDVRLNIFDPYRDDVPSSLMGATEKIQIVKEGLTDYFCRYGGRTAATGVRRKVLDMARARLKKRRESAWAPPAAATQ